VKVARQPSDRRFPPPWSIEDIGAAYVAKTPAVAETISKLARLASTV
jgi:hypothetical protein